MKERSQELELLDLGPCYYSREEYSDCLEKLYRIGNLTGINQESLSLIKKIAPSSIVDVGCGGGLFLRGLAATFAEIQCIGIDCAKEAIDFAKPYEQNNLSFFCTKEIPPADVVMATLVLHHLRDAELPEFLEKCYQAANKAVIINDLQRSRTSKALYKLISRWLFSNRLISHDGAISIARGFRKGELRQLFSPFEQVEIRWRVPFRWQVIIWKR